MHASYVLAFVGVVAAGYAPPKNTYTPPAVTPVVPPSNNTATGQPIIPTPGTQRPGNTTVPLTPISTPTSTGGGGHGASTGSGSVPTGTSTAEPSGVTGAASAHSVQGSVAALLGLVAAGMIAL